MRSKQYFTSIKNNPHEISTDPYIDHAQAIMKRLEKLGVKFPVTLNPEDEKEEADSPINE